MLTSLLEDLGKLCRSAFRRDGPGHSSATLDRASEASMKGAMNR